MKSASSRRKTRRKQLLLLMFVGLILWISFSTGISVEAATSIRGRVVDSKGLPIQGAEIYVLLEYKIINKTLTGADGFYEIELDPGYNVLFFADDPQTPGVDHIPSIYEGSSLGEEEVVVLEQAASIIMEGDIQFVESTELPVSTTYTVLDIENNTIQTGQGLTLTYGTSTSSLNNYIGLEENQVIVPAGVEFKVLVNCSVIIETNVVTRSFMIDIPSRPILSTGELIYLDTRPYSIRSNLQISETLLGSVKLDLDGMEEYGFYLIKERTETSAAERLLSESRFLLGEDRYIESFGACKTAYIDLAHTKITVNSMLRDASFSVYIIIVFLALSSTTIAFLLSNRDFTKILGGTSIFLATMVVLYYTYPGSIIVPLSNYVETALAAIGLSLIIAVLFPRFMKARGGDGHVPVRNMIVPIFSMAKRSIRRRRLRFSLTLISILVLVMSFVSLTSVSEDYGLIVGRVSSRPASTEGVLLRAPDFEDETPIFLTQRDVTSGWLQRQPESVTVSPKIESIPMRRPLTRIDGASVWGIVGFDPSLEVAVSDIAYALEEGDLPSEEGIAISRSLSEELGVEIGETMFLGIFPLRLEGILDDSSLRSLRELDGSPYLPGKMLNLSPPGEDPVYVYETCEPSEVVLMHISKAPSMQLVGISRISIRTGPEANAEAFAERLALERGYWAWSASAEGVYLARLGKYLEGKGLPLIVPWGIVVLNVVVTMLNSMFERKKEIHILSSVGLNPAQIAAIFVAEASIIGLTGGGLGYLLGLSAFKGMTFFGVALEIQQKVSAFWSLASIGIAMTAVLMGALAALRGSVIITPSLMMRWRIEKEEKGLFEPYEIILPVRLLPEELKNFVDFVVDALKYLENHPTRVTASIKVLYDVDGAKARINFIYKEAQAVGSSFYAKNELIFEESPVEDEIVIRLMSYGEREWAHTTGSLIRMIAMRWSTLKGRPLAD